MAGASPDDIAIRMITKSPHVQACSVAWFALIESHEMTDMMIICTSVVNYQWLHNFTAII